MLAELIESLPPSATRAQARQPRQDHRRHSRDEQLASALDDAAADLAQQASVLNLLSRQRTWAGDFDRAIADAQAAADIAETVGATAELAVARARRRRGVRRRADRARATRSRHRPRATARRPRGDSPTRIRGACALWGDDLETALACRDGRVAGGKPERQAIVLADARRNRAAPWRYRAGARTRPGRRGNRRILGGTRRGGRACRHRARRPWPGASTRPELPQRALEPRRQLRRHRPFGGASAHSSSFHSAVRRPPTRARTAHHAIGNRPPLRGRRRAGRHRGARRPREGRRGGSCALRARRTSAGLVTRARRLRCAGARRSSPRYEGKLDAAAAYAQEAIATSGEQLEPLERGRALLVLGQIRRRERRHAARERSRRLARSSRSAVPHSGRSGREPSCRESAAARPHATS